MNASQRSSVISEGHHELTAPSGHSLSRTLYTKNGALVQNKRKVKKVKRRKQRVS